MQIISEWILKFHIFAEIPLNAEDLEVKKLLNKQKRI